MGKYLIHYKQRSIKDLTPLSASFASRRLAGRQAKILTRPGRMNTRNTQCIPLVNPAYGGSAFLDLESRCKRETF